MPENTPFFFGGVGFFRHVARAAVVRCRVAPNSLRNRFAERRRAIDQMPAATGAVAVATGAARAGTCAVGNAACGHAPARMCIAG